MNRLQLKNVKMARKNQELNTLVDTLVDIIVDRLADTLAERIAECVNHEANRQNDVSDWQEVQERYWRKEDSEESDTF
jgi:hypothetical protein